MLENPEGNIMAEFKFSDAHLSNLLFWQVKCKQAPSVFWIKPIKTGSTVYTYDVRGDENPERFQFWNYCPNAK